MTDRHDEAMRDLAEMDSAIVVRDQAAIDAGYAKVNLRAYIDQNRSLEAEVRRITQLRDGQGLLLDALRADHEAACAEVERLTHTNPTSEAVEAALKRLDTLEQSCDLMGQAPWGHDEHTKYDDFSAAVQIAATLRAALTSAEEGARKAEAGIAALEERLAFAEASTDPAYYTERMALMQERLDAKADTITALTEVARAASARMEVWTRDTYVALEAALAHPAVQAVLTEEGAM